MEGVVGKGAGEKPSNPESWGCLSPWKTEIAQSPAGGDVGLQNRVQRERQRRFFLRKF